MPTSQAIFLSYAHEDTDAARRIADALRSHGIEVWFDQNELRGGDTWDQKIRRQIKECALFMPLVSANTQGRKEGYFRLEWKLAVERTHLMAEGVPFLTPVVADDTTESGALVPGEFLRVQWTRLPGALVTPQFIEQVKRLLGGSASPMPTPHTGSAAPRSPSAPAPSSETKPKFHLALVAGLGVAVLALVGYIALRPGARPTPPPVAPAQPIAETKSAPSPAPTANVLNKSIAVLPLANMSEDKDTGFFADGVHEDLLTNLALVSELKVVSRTSVMQYRGTTKTIKQIGEELGVAYVLEGSVRRSGNKVRVTGQLINTRTDEHVWAKSYDRDLTDVFSIQAELSKEIAGALSAAISPEAKKFLEHKPTENPVAYDLYLHGRDVRNRSVSGAAAPLAEAATLFQSAVQQDPKFAAAWGELAVAHALHGFWGIDGSAERLAQGDTAIAEAERLAPDLPDVIRDVGTYAYYARRDYAKATEKYSQLARLQPNDPTVFSSLGLIQRRQGRWAESLTNLKRAIELDPANVSYTRNLLASVEAVRRWDEVRAAHQRMIALLPDRPRELFAAADDEYGATGSRKAIDDLLAGLTAEQRDSPQGIYWRKFWSITGRDDYAEFKRLDQLQPSFSEEVEDPALSAIIAATVFWAHDDSAAMKERLDTPYREQRAKSLREPANAKVWSYLAMMEALLGRPEEALRLSRKAADMVPMSRDAVDGPIFTFMQAQVYAVVGDKDQALEALAHCLNVPGGFSVHQIRAVQSFAKLHGDPRFEALLNDPQNNAPLF